MIACAAALLLLFLSLLLAPIDSTNSNMASKAMRPLSRVVQCRRQMEGGGFPVRRPPIDNIGGLVLLFDHMGPMVIAPGDDFPGHEHPHRGFETISYHIQGTLEHHCSSGNTGIMGPGAAQWMTAGRGVVHGGNVPAALKSKGQTVEAFQIWINLPAKDKMVPPRYQDIDASALPVVRVPAQGGASSSSSASADGSPSNAADSDSDSTVKVVAGSYGGVTGRIDTHTPVSMLDVRLQPGARVVLDIPPEHVGIVYAYRGTAEVGSNNATLKEGMAGMLEEGEGAQLVLSAPASAPLVSAPAPHKRPEDLEGTEPVAAGIVIVFGLPIREPIARYGPFVMNTQAEIQQAFDDYRSGKMSRDSRVKGKDEEL